MKIQEVIRALKCEQEKNNNSSVDIAYVMAIEALEKQIPIKTTVKIHDKDTKIGNLIFSLGTKVHYCPRCNMPVTGSENYCRNCGQALIW